MSNFQKSKTIWLDNARNRPSISYLEWYILSLLDTLKEEKLKSKETIVHCCLILLILESASLCPFWAPSVLPKLTFALWACYREMEDWSGGGVGGGLGFSCLQKCRQSLSLLYLWFINRNIFSFPIHVNFEYKYWIHGCI